MPHRLQIFQMFQPETHNQWRLQKPLPSPQPNGASAARQHFPNPIKHTI